MPRVQKIVSSLLPALATRTIHKMHRRSSPRIIAGAERHYYALLIVTMITGGLFYLVLRTDALQSIQAGSNLPAIVHHLISAVLLPDIPLAIYQSLPSFIAGFSITLFVTALNPASKVAPWAPLSAAIFTLLLLEVLLGTFHWQDVAAILSGVSIGIMLICMVDAYLRVSGYESGNLSEISSESRCSNRFSHRLYPTTAAVVFSSLLAVGSTWPDGYFSSECARYSEEGYCEEYKKNAQPVFMSYSNLRSSVTVEQPRPLDRVGRLYLYNDHVFLNEVNEGIHILDNTDPTSPVNMAFIRIPGNTEIAIRDNYLYADSYIDLITLNISDLQNISVIGREESIFPYDEYQNIPQNVSFSNVDIKRELGVVVSYRLAGS